MSHLLSRSLRHRLFGAPLLVLMVSLVMACAPKGLERQNASPYGFLVLSPDGASAFGFADGDTVPELRLGQVPSAVLAAAGPQATLLRKDSACTRYFARADRVLALFVSTCQADQYLEDGRAIVGYSSAGRQLDRKTLWAPNFERVVVPNERPQ